MPRRDPRLGRAVNTANEQLRDRAIRHSLFVERLKTQQVRDLSQFLRDDVIPDVTHKLERNLREIRLRGPSRFKRITSTKRYQQMLVELREIVRSSESAIYRRTRSNFDEIAGAEARIQLQMFKDAIPLEISLTSPPPTLLRQISTNLPFEGRILRQWFRDTGDVFLNEAMRHINIGLVEGESVDQMIERIIGRRGFSGVMDRKFVSHVESIVRTGVIHTSAQARQLVAEENDDVIKGVQWVATLDDRTCPICGSLDGQVFDIKEGPRPPAHIRCRCTIVYITKSFRELGLDRDELPLSTRASMDGQVPQSLTYPKWLKQQSARVQDEALGPTRGRLFRQGKVTIDRFVDDQRQVISVKELLQSEGLE